MKTNSTGIECIAHIIFLANFQESAFRLHFYLNVTTLRSGICGRKSVCRRRLTSSGTFVYPTQPVKIFEKFFCAIFYRSHPLTSTQNLMEIVLGEPLRRELNASGVAKYRRSTCRWLYLGNSVRYGLITTSR